MKQEANTKKQAQDGPKAPQYEPPAIAWEEEFVALAQASDPCAGKPCGWSEICPC